MFYGAAAKRAVVAAFIALMAGSAASAATVTTQQGTVCAAGISTCSLGGSSAIARFTSGKLDLSGVSRQFPTIDGREFSFNVTKRKKGGRAIAGTWTYTPGAGDPMITGFLVRVQGVSKIVSGLSSSGGRVSGSWWTPKQKKLGNITFFGIAAAAKVSEPDETPDIAPVPLPAGGLLLLTGLGAIGLMRRRKSA